MSTADALMLIENEPRFVTLSCLEDRDDALLRETALRVNDWDRVMELAAANGVAAFTQRAMQQFENDSVVPAGDLNRLSTIVATQTARNLELRLTLERLLRLTANANIPLIVLKGAAVAHSMYERPILRPSEDVDVLCRDGDFDRLHSLMVTNGFAAEDTGGHSEDKCSPLETSFERHYRDDSSKALIEVHVDGVKLGVKPVHSESIWERAVEVEIGAETALSLSFSDMAFMLSVHLHRHGFNRLIWFKDIDLLLRRFGDRIDWDLVIEQARDEGAASSLWLTLDYLQRLMGTPVPEAVMAEVRPGLLTRFGWRRVWPRKRVLNLTASTRRRTVQFSVEESLRGMLPSLLLMGRRRQKLQIMARRLLHR